MFYTLQTGHQTRRQRLWYVSKHRAGRIFWLSVAAIALYSIEWAV